MSRRFEMAGSVGLPWAVLTFSGELDMSRGDELDAIAASTFRSEKVNAIFDLSDVAFMDSSALRWLLKVQERADQTGGCVRLVAPDSGSLIRLLALTGLADRFAVFPTRTDAEQASPRMTEAVDDMLPFTVVQ
jgi:anti-sigma B factor antagonist